MINQLGNCFLHFKVDFPFTQYKFFPIEDGKIRGSCEDYKSRKLVFRDKVLYLSISDVAER